MGSWNDGCCQDGFRLEDARLGGDSATGRLSATDILDLVFINFLGKGQPTDNHFLR